MSYTDRFKCPSRMDKKHPCVVCGGIIFKRSTGKCRKCSYLLGKGRPKANQDGMPKIFIEYENHFMQNVCYD